MYIWAGITQEEGGSKYNRLESQQLFHKVIQVMVELRDKRMIYGKISSYIREDYSKDKIIAYLMGKSRIGINISSLPLTEMP